MTMGSCSELVCKRSEVRWSAKGAEGDKCCELNEKRSRPLERKWKRHQDGCVWNRRRAERWPKKQCKEATARTISSIMLRWLAFASEPPEPELSGALGGATVFVSLCHKIAAMPSPHTTRIIQACGYQ